MTASALVMAFLLAGCGGSPAPPAPPSVGSRPRTPEVRVCLADGLGPLQTRSWMKARDHACEDAGTCERRCSEDDANACVLHAWKVEKASGIAAAQPWLARACQLGESIACTAHGEYLWKPDQGWPDVSCARRLFHRACDASDDAGCFRLAQAMGDEAGTAAEQATAERFFQLGCSREPHKYCRLYGDYLERGAFGPPRPELFNSLMHVACHHGDQNACERRTGPLPTLN